MELFHCHIIPVCTLCMVFIMGVSLVYSSESTAQMSTVVKYRIQQYCQKLNFTTTNEDCGSLVDNVSRIMEACRKENYSSSCNVYTNPNDESIFFCMKTEGSSQCINILCNLTFKRETDPNPRERIDTDTLSPTCIYKYATMESKDCVTSSGDEERRGHTERSQTNLSGRGWSMLLAAFLAGVMVSSIIFFLRDWIRKRWNTRHSITSISVQTEDSHVTNAGYLNAVYTDISNLQGEESSNDDTSILDPGMCCGIDPVIPDLYNYSRPEEEQKSDVYNILQGLDEGMLSIGKAENEKTLNDALLTSGEQSLLTKKQSEDMQQLYFCLEKREDATLFNETPC
ncbi:uncharacterized protein LOC125672666 [Ostrea edulis]|uniref:uncharacterized protein LOC125672666 n=1 Tax=Ostrea edulis TaxID=37623 RepID=UPI0024AE916D|nr:uncharacterized protein LOC125672666 [Ostrea edulis]